MPENADFELLAASLRADGRDLDAFVEALAVKLEGAIPGRTTVTRRSMGLLSRAKRVAAISLDLGDERLLLEVKDGDLAARRATTVRGIVLKSEPLSLDEWIEALARAIAAAATASEQGRLALERLLGLGVWSDTRGGVP